MQILSSLLFATAVLPFLVFTVSACSDSTELAVTDSALNLNVDVTQGPVNVFPDLVVASAKDEQAPVLLSAEDGTQAPLFDNTGFENNFAGWSVCKSDAGASGVVITTDAYEGTKAVEVQPGNCFYRSAAVLPGDDVLLRCVAKSSDASKWSALGLGFSDTNWITVTEAPSSLVSSEKYSTYSVRATVPDGVSYASMWFYSDATAMVDDCTLLLLNGDPNTIVPLDSSDNLLENGSFTANANGGPSYWYVGCDAKGTAVVNSNGELQLSDNACVAQSLSSDDLDFLRGNSFIFECNAQRTSNTHYADMVIGFDGKETAVSELSNGKYSISGKVSDTVTSGFVGMYSELSGGDYVGFSDCYLSISADPDAEEIPLPDEPDPSDLDPEADPDAPSEPQAEWPLPRDLDGNPSLAEVHYVPELDISWLRFSVAGRDGDYGVEDFRGFVEADSVDAFLNAINSANYLGFNGWRLPIGHGQATVDCETQGDTSLPECYLEAGFMNQKMADVYGGIASGPFAYWPRRSRWVGSSLSGGTQYYYEFDAEPATALRFCGQDGLDQAEACESKFIWLVHDGDIGTPIE